MSNQLNPNKLAGGSHVQEPPTPYSNTEPNEHPILDENEQPKTRKISALCEQIGCVYHATTADVSFVFDVNGNEELVPAHKSILAFHSPVFRQMFYSELKERFNESSDIRLTDTTVDAFIDFMKCIYSVLHIDGLSEIKISQLVYLAHKYDVDWLEEECIEILGKVIEENIQSILWVIPLANLYSYNTLRYKCIGRIWLHGDSLMDSPEFTDCEREVLKQILWVRFRNRNEFKVFKACIDWAKRACEKAELDPETPGNLRSQLGNCFALIRFDSMTAQQFMQCLSINPKMFSPNEIQRIANKITEFIMNESQREFDFDVEAKEFRIYSPFITTSSTMQRFLDDKTTADVAIVFGNEKTERAERILAHKCILARKSNVFAQRFVIAANEEINITGITADAFKYFLRLMYAYYFPNFDAIAKHIADEHIDAILSMAKTYDVKQIIELYPVHLIRTVNVQNVILRFELSRKHSMDLVKLECVNFMKKNGTQVIQSDGFLDCSQPIFKLILELGIWDWNSLIDACIEWAKRFCRKYQFDPGNSKHLRDAFGDAFELIPFSSMDPLDLIDFQSDYGDMFTYDELKKLINGLAKRRKRNHP